MQKVATNNCTVDDWRFSYRKGEREAHVVLSKVIFLHILIRLSHNMHLSFILTSNRKQMDVVCHVIDASPKFHHHSSQMQSLLLILILLPKVICAALIC